MFASIDHRFSARQNIVNPAIRLKGNKNSLSTSWMPIRSLFNFGGYFFNMLAAFKLHVACRRRLFIRTSVASGSNIPKKYRLSRMERPDICILLSISGSLYRRRCPKNTSWPDQRNLKAGTVTKTLPPADIDSKYCRSNPISSSTCSKTSIIRTRDGLTYSFERTKRMGRPKWYSTLSLR